MGVREAKVMPWPRKPREGMPSQIKDSRKAMVAGKSTGVWMFSVRRANWSRPSRSWDNSISASGTP